MTEEKKAKEKDKKRSWQPDKRQMVTIQLGEEPEEKDKGASSKKNSENK